MSQHDRHESAAYFLSVFPAGLGFVMIQEEKSESLKPHHAHVVVVLHDPTFWYLISGVGSIDQRLVDASKGSSISPFSRGISNSFTNQRSVYFPFPCQTLCFLGLFMVWPATSSSLSNLWLSSSSIPGRCLKSFISSCSIVVRSRMNASRVREHHSQFECPSAWIYQ